MDYLPASAVDAQVRDRASRIKLVCFDVDGTLTDGRLYIDNEGRESKAFHVLDGQGLVLLRRSGVVVVLITARHSPAAQKRAAELGVEVFVGAKDKLAQVRLLCNQHSIGLDEVCFMGDDLPDLGALCAVGLAVAPGNAHPWILARSHWQTRATGGSGAARELCDLILDAQGHVDALIEEWTR